MARSRRRTLSPSPQRLILDSGAVIALARNHVHARAVLAAAWKAGAEVSIPSVVLAETVRGSAQDAPVNRVIKAVGDILPIDESTGRVAGALLGAAPSDSTVDAMVVATAVRIGGGVVLTGDSSDLQALAHGHPKVVVQPL